MHDPNELLRGALTRYACLKKGSTIVVDHEGEALLFNVLDLDSVEGPLPLGAGAMIIDLDLEVDFAPAPDIARDGASNGERDITLHLLQTLIRRSSSRQERADHR